MTKKTRYPAVTTLKNLAISHGLIPKGKEHLKYTEIEVLSLLETYMSSIENRLEKAKTIFRKQDAEIAKLSQQQLWRFNNNSTAPPDFREEYMRKIQQEDREKGRIKMVKS